MSSLRFDSEGEDRNGLHAPDEKVVRRDAESSNEDKYQVLPPLFDSVKKRRRREGGCLTPPGRTQDHYRRNRALLFHVPCERLPKPLARLNVPTDPSAEDPIRTRRVTNVREAQSLMNAESVYMASQLQSEIARCRIHAHTPGFTRIGSVRATLSSMERAGRVSSVNNNPRGENSHEPSSLHFYLGQDTRMVL